MAPFDLHLMRHGAPDAPHLMLGRTDAAPSAEGVAACLARAQGLAVEAVVSSDLARAREPARLIAGERDVPLTVDSRWRELDFGDWDGQRPDAIDPAALGRFWSDANAHPPPGGESWSALVHRVAAVIADLPPRPTLIVTHGGAMRAGLAHLCGFTQGMTASFSLPYAALLSLRIWPGDPQTVQIMGLSA